MTLTPEQAAHYKMLAEAHKDTPCDLAEAYRDRGTLVDEISNMQVAQVSAMFELQSALENYPTDHRFDASYNYIRKALNALTEDAS